MAFTKASTAQNPFAEHVLHSNALPMLSLFDIRYLNVCLLHTRSSHMHSLVRLAIVVLLDISGSMTLAGFEVPRDRDAMPGRAYGDVRAKDRVVFTDRARNSNMRGKVFDF